MAATGSMLIEWAAIDSDCRAQLYIKIPHPFKMSMNI